MAEIEKIQGDAILQILKVLQKDKVPLKMNRADDTTAHLTTISDIRKRRGAFFFEVHSPESFFMTEDDADRPPLQFEFSDKESIKFGFTTGLGEISRGAIWVRFPEFIYRYQRRGLYRLEAPHGTSLFFAVDHMPYKLLVINVSLGGTLGVLVNLTKQMEQALQSLGTKTLQDVELVFPSKREVAEESIIKIERCQLKRQQMNPATKKFECALEFKEIREDEARKFRQLFYEWQRRYLRKRKLLKA